MLRAIAALLLIIGNVLVVTSVFVPWLVLETTLANSFGSGELSPWTAIVGSGNGPGAQSFGGFSPFGLFYLFLVIGSTGYSLDLLRALILRSRTPNWGLAFSFALTVLAVGSCMLVSMASRVLPDGLGLTWPYFVTRMDSMDIGAQMALLGALGVLLGAVLARTRVHPTTEADSGEHLATSESEPASP